MNEESSHQLDRAPPTLVVHTAVIADPGLLLHFPSNVIEDVLPRQRTAVEGLGDLGPDLVPRTPNLLAQIASERSEQVGEFLPIRGVLATTRDWRTSRAVIIEFVLALAQPTAPLLAALLMPAPRPFRDDPGHVVS